MQRKQMRLAECRLGVGKVSETLFGFGSKFWVEEASHLALRSDPVLLLSDVRRFRSDAEPQAFCS